MLIKVIDDHFRNGISLEFNYNARVFIRLIANSTDICDDLLVNEICNALLP